MFLAAATAAFALLQGRSARRQSTRLKRMLEATSDLFAVVGADGRYQSNNAAALTGYSPEELRRIPLGGLVHPEDTAAAKEAVRQVMTGAVYHRWEGRLVHKTGRTIWVDTALFFDPEEQVMHLISWDVTERKRAELDLQDRERRLRSLVEHHPDAVVVLDRDGAIVQAVLSFAAAVNLTTVGEGVETEEQREMLRQLGCHFGQGYLFAAPLPPDELVRYLGGQGVR